MRLAIWPYVNVEGQWTIPDQVMIGVWNKIIELDRAEATFYDGNIQNADEFLFFMKQTFNLPLLIVDQDEPKFYLLAWLNDMQDGIAHAHFCFLDKYNKEYAKAGLDYWKRIETLKVIIGITPESYETVLKIIEDWGFKIVGTIPKICDMKYLDRRESGVISYYLMEE